MARKQNHNRTKTPVMIDKSLKANLDRLRNEDKNRNGNESDNTLLTRIISKYMQEHGDEVHEPRRTYTSKTD
jgi:hypothetical protein